MSWSHGANCSCPSCNGVTGGIMSGSLRGTIFADDYTPRRPPRPVASGCTCPACTEVTIGRAPTEYDAYPVDHHEGCGCPACKAGVKCNLRCYTCLPDCKMLESLMSGYLALGTHVISKLETLGEAVKPIAGPAGEVHYTDYHEDARKGLVVEPYVPKHPVCAWRRSTPWDPEDLG